MFAVCEDQAHGKHQVSPCAATLAHGETGARAMRVLLPSGVVLGLTDLYPMEEKGMSICKKKKKKKKKKLRNKMLLYLLFFKKIALELHITMNLNLKDRSSKHKPNNKTYYTESRSQFSQT